MWLEAAPGLLTDESGVQPSISILEPSPAAQGGSFVGGGGGLWPGQEATFLIGTWKLMAKGQAQAELGLCVGKEIRGPALWSLTFEDFLPEIKESE